MKILVLLTMAPLLMGSIYAKKDCEVKFISYNIRYEGAAADTGALDWKNRKEATVNMIRQEQPSVIGFQEPRPTQTTFVIEQFPDYGHVYAKMDKGEIPAGSSVLILYNKKRCKLLDWGYFWLNEKDIHSEVKGWDAHNLRPTSWVKLKDRKTKTIFYYFNTHLDHKGQVARIEGVELLIRQMKEIAGENAHVVIAGDMNCNPQTAFDTHKDGKPVRVLQPFYDWMKGGRETARITDDHYTFNGFGKIKTFHWLDYFFYRNGQALKFETLTKDYGAPYISDHYPIALTLNF